MTDIFEVSALYPISKNNPIGLQINALFNKLFFIRQQFICQKQTKLV